MDHMLIHIFIPILFIIFLATKVQQSYASPKSEHHGEKSDSDEAKAKHLVKEQKLEILLANILMQLSKYDDDRKGLLVEPDYDITHSNAECYLKTFNVFKEKCVPQHFHRRVKKHRNIFAHACLADWINLREICNIIKETCEGVKFDED